MIKPIFKQVIYQGSIFLRNTNLYKNLQSEFSLQTFQILVPALDQLALFHFNIPVKLPRICQSNSWNYSYSNVHCCTRRTPFSCVSYLNSKKFREPLVLSPRDNSSDRCLRIGQWGWERYYYSFAKTKRKKKRKRKKNERKNRTIVPEGIKEEGKSRDEREEASSLYAALSL